MPINANIWSSVSDLLQLLIREKFDCAVKFEADEENRMTMYTNIFVEF